MVGTCCWLWFEGGGGGGGCLLSYGWWVVVGEGAHHLWSSRMVVWWVLIAQCWLCNMVVVSPIVKGDGDGCSSPIVVEGGGSGEGSLLVVEGAGDGGVWAVGAHHWLLLASHVGAGGQLLVVEGG